MDQVWFRRLLEVYLATSADELTRLGVKVSLNVGMREPGVQAWIVQAARHEQLFHRPHY